jgi:hypothetical protein
VVVFVAFAAGCGDDDWIAALVGRYDGFVAAGSGIAVEDQYVVTGNLVQTADHLFTLRVASANGGRRWGVHARALNGNQIALASRRIDTHQDTRLVLTKESDSCFSGEGAKVCNYATELYIEMPVALRGEHAVLVLRKINDSSTPLPVLEEPRSYTLNEIFNRALFDGFEARTEFERYTQARLNAEHAALSLLPHFSANTALSFIVFGALGPLALIADLCPFLFPSRWTEALRMDLLSDAEFYGLLLVKADAAHVVEGLALSVERETKMLEVLERAYSEAYSQLELVRLQTEIGILPRTASGDLRVLLNSMEQGATNVRALRDSELASLSLALGFFNPLAVSGVTTVGVSMDRAELPENERGLGELALRRSYEISQLNALVEASDVSLTERHLAWIDPAGNPAGSVGFGLPAYVSVGYSEAREVRIRRERAQAQVLHKVHDSVSLMTRALGRYNIAVENAAVQAEHRARRDDQVLIGAGPTGQELVQALQDEARVAVERIDAEYAYHIAVANLNRALYAGPYASISPERGRPRIARSLHLSR